MAGSKKKKVKLKIPDINDGPVYLVKVSGSENNNKYYNMIPNSDGFEAVHGRVGQTKNRNQYPSSKWNSIYRSKRNSRGYSDQTEMNKTRSVAKEASNNSSFDEFFDKFSAYANLKTGRSYNIKSCSQEQLNEANKLLDKISNLKTLKAVNNNLEKLFEAIPRKMDSVSAMIAPSLRDVPEIVAREQEALDSMDSSNISSSTNPFDSLNVTWDEVENINSLRGMFSQFSYGDQYFDRIHKIYKISKPSCEDDFETELGLSNKKKTMNLIHGTRNPNVFSILKSGLLIRPSNAFYSGSAYGDGIYHSSDFAKSHGYTGGSSDYIMFLQDVNVGKQAHYSGWYREGKEFSSRDFNYKGMKSKGYDSLFVQQGDGLLSSEYVVYNNNQTKFDYLVWFKK